MTVETLVNKNKNISRFFKILKKKQILQVLPEKSETCKTFNKWESCKNHLYIYIQIKDSKT